jgi:hypothetical protein
MANAREWVSQHPIKSWSRLVQGCPVSGLGDRVQNSRLHVLKAYKGDVGAERFCRLASLGRATSWRAGARTRAPFCRFGNEGSDMWVRDHSAVRAKRVVSGDRVIDVGAVQTEKGSLDHI